MLWPLILPTQITFYIFLSTLFVLVIIAPRLKWKRLNTLLIGIFLSLLLFIPSCMGIQHVLNQYRFGWASYPDFHAIQDFRVERYIPPQATQITVFKHYHGNGYFGRFRISQPDLTTWHDSKWAEIALMPDADTRAADDKHVKIAPEFLPVEFEKSGWKFPGDLIKFTGPRAPNGAGYDIFYSPSEQQAYVDGGYW